MDRLTYKHDDNWCVSGLNGKLISDKHANYWGEAIDRLTYYEDLEEQGRLVVLPCNVGDTVYRVCKKKYDVDGYGMQWEEDWGIVTNSFHLGMFHEIGKNVFLTREEAEAVLNSK